MLVDMIDRMKHNFTQIIDQDFKSIEKLFYVSIPVKYGQIKDQLNKIYSNYDELDELRYQTN